jgi:hypothetical protein
VQVLVEIEVEDHQDHQGPQAAAEVVTVAQHSCPLLLEEDHRQAVEIQEVEPQAAVAERHHRHHHRQVQAPSLPQPDTLRPASAACHPAARSCTF